jgi:hypothetical protein
MTTHKIRKAVAKPAAAAAVTIAGFTVEQQAGFRTAVAAALTAGKKDKEAKEAKGTATDRLIVALACPALLAHRFEFQARDRKGAVIETKLASLYEYARKAAPFYVAGKVQPLRLTGFKAAILAYAGINDPTSDIAEKGWAIIKGQALKTAIALADNTIAASLIDGKLALSGGNGTAPAAKLLNAAKTSTRALVATVNAKGTNKPKTAAPTDKAKQAATVAAAKAMDIDAAVRAAAVYLQRVAAGDDAITNKRLGLLKAIARDAAAIIAQEAAAAAAKPAKPAAKA